MSSVVLLFSQDTGTSMLLLRLGQLMMLIEYTFTPFPSNSNPVAVKEVSSSKRNTCIVLGNEMEVTPAPFASSRPVRPLPFARKVFKYKSSVKSIEVMFLQPRISNFSRRFALAMEDMEVRISFVEVPLPKISSFNLEPRASFHTLFNSTLDKRGRMLLKSTLIKFTAE